MRVIILGSRGMLGSACYQYLTKKKINVDAFDERFKISNYKGYKSKLEALNPDVVINCIGKIPQKKSSLCDYYEANIVLPKLLSEINNNIILIHASTDCVFEENNALESGSVNKTTAYDDYGMSKSIGDKLITNRPNGYVIRTSIIGFTSNFESEGLLDWLARNKDNLVYGYDDHIWNGITTKAWAKFIYQQFIDSINYKFLSPITHLGINNPVSKYTLLQLVNEIFCFNANVVSKSAGHCDRSLIVDITLGSIEDQIRDLVNE